MILLLSGISFPFLIKRRRKWLFRKINILKNLFCRLNSLPKGMSILMLWPKDLDIYGVQVKIFILEMLEISIICLFLNLKLMSNKYSWVNHGLLIDILLSFKGMIENLSWRVWNLILPCFKFKFTTFRLFYYALRWQLKLEIC